jgi:lipid II:glycine glycyltransferase (peptidoglycan interpeptide bridge formation enzyme)
LTQGSQTLYRFEPLNDPRWRVFLQNHPRASVFHSTEWLEALRRTYGYETIAMTTSPPDVALQNAVVFCRVESWLTGRRLVSLPFSDHCDVLTDSEEDLATMTANLEKEVCQQKLRYAELRTTRKLNTALLGSHSVHACYLHYIDLRPDLNTLLKNCHGDSTRRKIRRAEREGLIYEEGRSADLLDSFYRLLLLTRRRHLLPPQPKKWFQTLIDSFGAALKIRVAFKDNLPISAILTLRYKNTLVYKYGCSDAKFHPLGGMHLLLWKSIEDAKQDGLDTFDLGRSECEHSGLVTFKDHWSASRMPITYIRLLSSAQSKGAFKAGVSGWKVRAAKSTLRYLPDCILSSAGDLAYKHMG